MEMDKKTRYMASAGLAFAEHKEMNKLSKLSEQGWFLEKFSFLGYTLRNGPSHKLIYCLDIRQLQENELNNYREIFEAGGWNHVCSSGDLHVFSAEPGTEPIYTDRTSTFEKYSRTLSLYKMASFILLVLTIGIIGLLYLSAEVWQNVIIQNAAAVGLVFFSILLVPSIMMFVAYSLRVNKLKS